MLWPLNTYMYLQVFEIFSRGCQCGHTSEVPHVDPSRVHGCLQTLSISGDEGELNTLSDHTRHNDVCEEGHGLAKQVPISLQYLLQWREVSCADWVYSHTHRRAQKAHFLQVYIQCTRRERERERERECVFTCVRCIYVCMHE